MQRCATLSPPVFRERQGIPNCREERRGVYRRKYVEGPQGWVKTTDLALDTVHHTELVEVRERGGVAQHVVKIIPYGCKRL